MGLAMVLSGAVVGVSSSPVQVEVDFRRQGLRQFKVVGLPESAVTEGRVRVETALQNAGFGSIAGRVTVNLAPAHLKKAGTAYDLPIALAVLAARPESIPGLAEGLAGCLVVGELALDGQVRSVRGGLPHAMLARELGLSRIVVPRNNGSEADAVEGLEVVAVDDLVEAVEILRGALPVPALPVESAPVPLDTEDLRDVRGQSVARRALEVAAAGGHNVLFVGPPGSGKTMLARRLVGICPPLTSQEALQVSAIHSVKGLLAPGSGVVWRRPFRSPHHTVSLPALIGGGRGTPVPGEVSLAHRGVLFLDELAEFPRAALESLRQPLESGEVIVGRVQETLCMPASFMLVAAMNPCPCGYRDTSGQLCTCTPNRVESYRARASGPLLDRIDLQVRVPALSWADLASRREAESSSVVRERVCRARSIQRTRGSERASLTNAMLGSSLIREHCMPDPEGSRLLRRAIEGFRLSARAHDRILKVARTVADLEDSDRVKGPHVAEALQFRLSATPRLGTSPSLRSQ